MNRAKLTSLVLSLIISICFFGSLIASQEASAGLKSKAVMLVVAKSLPLAFKAATPKLKEKAKAIILNKVKKHPNLVPDIISKVKSFRDKNPKYKHQANKLLERIRANSNLPVKRQGPKGVDPNHHNANATIRNSLGKITQHERFVSGNMTSIEKALGFPKNTLATHTEARIMRKFPFKKGDTLTITGQRPPCNMCKGRMNEASKESGATIKYQWREDGKTRVWLANQK